MSSNAARGRRVISSDRGHQYTLSQHFVSHFVPYTLSPPCPLHLVLRLITSCSVTGHGGGCYENDPAAPGGGQGARPRPRPRRPRSTALPVLQYCRIASGWCPNPPPCHITAPASPPRGGNAASTSAMPFLCPPFTAGSAPSSPRLRALRAGGTRAASTCHCLLPLPTAYCHCRRPGGGGSYPLGRGDAKQPQSLAQHARHQRAEARAAVADGRVGLEDREALVEAAV